MAHTDYSANETNGLLNGAEYHDSVNYEVTYTLGMVKDAGGRISRLRLLTESWAGTRMADVSYIHATLADGTIVPVQVGIGTGPLWGKQGIKSQLIDWAKREGVYAKAIGLLDESVWSIMY